MKALLRLRNHPSMPRVLDRKLNAPSHKSCPSLGLPCLPLAVSFFRILLLLFLLPLLLTKAPLFMEHAFP